MLKRLVERREQLVVRSRQQSELVRCAAIAAAERLSLVDTATSWIRRFRWRPVFAVGTLLASMAVGSRGSLAWLGRAGAIYSAFRQGRELFSALRQAGSRTE
jgi:hypothetical protein